MVSADVAAQRWVNGLSGASQKISEGIDAVTVAPGQAAARQKAAWVQNTTSAADRWATRVGRVSLTDWQTAAKSKGVARIAPGASAAQGQMVSVMAKLLPAIDGAVKGLPARGTFEQNVQRSVTLMQKLHAMQGQFGG